MLTWNSPDEVFVYEKFSHRDQIAVSNLFSAAFNLVC